MRPLNREGEVIFRQTLIKQFSDSVGLDDDVDTLSLWKETRLPYGYT